MMKKQAVIYELLQENNGFVTLNQVKESGVSYYTVKKMIGEGKLEKDEPGLYRLPKAYIDEYYSIQHRYPKGVYSLETALWLHGLSLTIPFEPMMSFPYGTNTKLIKEYGIKPIILRSNYDEGIVEVMPIKGQAVNVYSVERTLVECLRSIYKIDVQIIAPAFKMYARQNKINYSQLFKYAKLFKVERKIQSYLEVLD